MGHASGVVGGLESGDWLGARGRLLASASRAAGMVGLVTVGVCGAAFVATALWISRGPGPYPWWVDVPIQSVGVMGLVVGLFVWARSLDGARMGQLLTAFGITWYLGDLQLSDNPVLFRLGFWLFHLNVVILAHLLLAFPDGRLARRSERITVAALYAQLLLFQGLRMVSERPLRPEGWGDPTAEYSIWAGVGSVTAIVFVVIVLALVVRRWRAEPRPALRARALFWAAVVLMGMVVALAAVASLLHAPVHVQGVLSLVYAVAALLLGAAVPVGSLRLQLAHQRVSRLVAQLQQSRPAGLEALRDQVAEALEDPSLTLHYRRPDSGDCVEYVDLLGRPAPLPRDGRVVTFVGPEDAPLAALAHDPFLCCSRQRERLDAVVAAARLALENASLYAAQQAHLRGLLEVEKSTRLDIQAMLHDGTQHRLSNVQLLIGQARSLRTDPELDTRLSEIADELQRAVEDLREVTQGVYPSTLRMGGLAPALDGLVQRSSLHVDLDVPRQRWPEHVEDAAFFIVSEAVGNAQRHAQATLVTVHVREADGHLLVEVVDDGAGGATQRADGNGLRSMRNRAAALAGTLDVNSIETVGTTVRARLPCE